MKADVLTLVRFLRGTSFSDDRPLDQKHFGSRLSQFGTLPGVRPIVFLGDSRVEGAEWSEYLGRPDVSNRGIAGDTTAGVLLGLHEAVPNHASLCIMQLGINDLILGYPVKSIINNYDAILGDLFKRVHAEVVVTSIILAGKEFGALNKSIVECNRELRGLAARRGAVWVDLNPALCADGCLSSELNVDGVHMNGEGYRRICTVLNPYLGRWAGAGRASVEAGRPEGPPGEEPERSRVAPPSRIAGAKGASAP